MCKVGISRISVGFAIDKTESQHWLLAQALAQAWRKTLELHFKEMADAEVSLSSDSDSNATVLPKGVVPTLTIRASFINGGRSELARDIIEKLQELANTRELVDTREDLQEDFTRLADYILVKLQSLAQTRDPNDQVMVEPEVLKEQFEPFMQNELEGQCEPFIKWLCQHLQDRHAATGATVANAAHGQDLATSAIPAKACPGKLRRAQAAATVPPPPPKAALQKPGGAETAVLGPPPPKAAPRKFRRAEAEVAAPPPPPPKAAPWKLRQAAAAALGPPPPPPKAAPWKFRRTAAAAVQPQLPPSGSSSSSRTTQRHDGDSHASDPDHRRVVSEKHTAPQNLDSLLRSIVAVLRHGRRHRRARNISLRMRDDGFASLSEVLRKLPQLNLGTVPFEEIRHMVTTSRRSEGTPRFEFQEGERGLWIRAGAARTSRKRRLYYTTPLS